MCFYTQRHLVKSKPQYRHLGKIYPLTWEPDYARSANSVKTLISNIRSKLNEPKTITFIYFA